MNESMTDTGLAGEPITALPFVRFKSRASQFWCVPPTHDYAEACEKGREYAATLAQHIKDNPGQSGLFARIVAAMNHTDTSPAKGNRAGFLFQWERLAMQRAQGIELFAGLYVENERHRHVIVESL